ncbi:MAG: DNA repair protein RecO [Lawsonibacter sp.]|nr:DNA repair protein RecO [Lawsonibacter sp.]
MHVTTNALVLRGVDYKESDKILTLLTQELGKLTASARGCRKKGSALATGCQLLCWSQVVLYDYGGRWSVKEAATLREFQGVRAGLDKLALACYFAEVTELLAVEGLPSPELLSLLLNSLHALDRMDKPLPLVKAAFEGKSMCLAGYEPALESCAACGAEQPESPRFYLQEGELRCAACLEAQGPFLPLDASALAALRHIVYGNPKRLFSFRAEGESLLLLAGLTEAYLQVQLEREFQTLDFYKQVRQ